jgi:hypothetical protein
MGRMLFVTAVVLVAATIYLERDKIKMLEEDLLRKIHLN